MTKRFHPHDLLRIETSRIAEILLASDPANRAAIEGCMQRAPVVVVRRALTDNGFIPVGVRGADRSERFAAWLDPKGIRQVAVPCSLRTSADTRDLPAFFALRELERRWQSLELPWGPTGSAGFELATGETAVTSSSDLDLLLRARDRLTHDDLRKIAEACIGLPCTVDIQIETPHGAFALQEYLSTRSKLLLRTCCGPILVYDPWRLPGVWKMPA